jgi:F-type H+-transporting ATPase subunit delta
MPRPSPARRYAEAIYELSTRDGKVDEWRREMALVCELASDKRLVRVLDSPAVGFADRRAAVERLLAGRVSREVLNLTLILTSRNRFALIPAVGAEYDALVRRSRGIVGVTVTSATPLSEAELAALSTRLEQIAGGKVEMATNTDASLIGGLRVMIGDHQMDASVVTRLARLRRQLVQGTS